ncbi:MAG: PilZ domain-containing protein [Planctomycetota bacterium]
MSDASAKDRRAHQRFPLATSVQFHHAQSRRDFPGRSVDLSGGGMLMYVPATAPVHTGQTIKLNLGHVPISEVPDFAGRDVNATVVRVDRNTLLSSGHIAVGVHFHRA